MALRTALFRTIRGIESPMICAVLVKFHMEQQQLTRKDLEKILGARMPVAEVLNRKRGLSINMIRALHEKLGISVDVLIRSIWGLKAA